MQSQDGEPYRFEQAVPVIADGINQNVAYIIYAVSYTHLDVYKRQVVLHLLSDVQDMRKYHLSNGSGAV